MYYMLNSSLHSHLHLDGFVRAVPHDGEVAVVEAVDVRGGGVDLDGGELPGGAGDLLLQRVYVVGVDVRVPDGVNELPWLHVMEIER